MASARVAVSREMDIEQAHELIEQIERYVACRLGVLLVIHVDPVEVRDEYVLRQINRMEGRYLCIITMDNSYVADKDAEDD